MTERKCSDCGRPISRRSKRRCQHCCNAVAYRSPEARARLAALLSERRRDPWFNQARAHAIAAKKAGIEL